MAQDKITTLTTQLSTNVTFYLLYYLPFISLSLHTQIQLNLVYNYNAW